MNIRNKFEYVYRIDLFNYGKPNFSFNKITIYCTTLQTIDEIKPFWLESYHKYRTSNNLNVFMITPYYYS